MLYVINGIIKFRSEDGVVLQEGHEDPVVTLSATMSRLLVFLLERQGIVCQRTEILEKVWDAHGLRSSNNSLNRYITDLRKLFSRLGIEEDVITTVPKIGFIFSADIEVKKEIVSNDVVNRFGVIPEKISTKKKNYLLYITFIFLLSSILIPILFANDLINIDISPKNNVAPRQTFPLGTFQKCEIRILNTASNAMTPIKLAIAEDLIRKSGMKCDEISTVYVQIADPVIYGYKDRVFISQCNRASSDNSKFSSCKNYYEVDYDVQH